MLTVHGRNGPETGNEKNRKGRLLEHSSIDESFVDSRWQFRIRSKQEKAVFHGMVVVKTCAEPLNAFRVDMNVSLDRVNRTGRAIQTFALGVHGNLAKQADESAELIDWNNVPGELAIASTDGGSCLPRFVGYSQ